MNSLKDGPQQVYRIELVTGESFPCASDEKILIAMERANVTGIQVGCRGGGCGACRVEVLSGEYDALRMSAAHVDEDEAQAGFALACRVLPKSDLMVRFAPKQNEENLPEKQQDEPQAIAAGK